ncbi:MAG: glycoside hydrolase family 2 TIM barrel-domain containing protein [Candidatus Omnitrophota bacterium]
MNNRACLFFFKRTRREKKENNKKPGAKLKTYYYFSLLVFLFFYSLGCKFSKLSQRPPISIVKQKNSHFQLLINKKPFVIKAVSYNPIPIGKDFSFDFWQQDLKVFRTDAQLMKDMGVNAIRIYQPGRDIKRTKEIIRLFYNEFGIYTIMGNWLGFWQGAYPDYANYEFRERVQLECLSMVKEFKDEPGILLWVLGNENNFSFGRQNLRVWTSVDIEKIIDPREKQLKKAAIYYKFVNDLAGKIKLIDKTHLIALGNGGFDFIDVAVDYSSNIDLLACSSYSGKSFGSIFRQVKAIWKKPFFFSEFGCDSFNALTEKPDEQIQAQFISSQWKEIKKNLAFGNGEGNCLGGVIFEWTDEWWKANEYDATSLAIHDVLATWSNGAYYFDIAAKNNLNMNEEWWGIVGLSPKENFDARIPKQAYYALKELWKEE